MQVHFLKFIRRLEAMSGYFNLDLYNTHNVTNKYCICFAPHILQLKPLNSPSLSAVLTAGVLHGELKNYFTTHTHTPDRRKDGHHIGLWSFWHALQHWRAITFSTLWINSVRGKKQDPFCGHGPAVGALHCKSTINLLCISKPSHMSYEMTL